MEPIRMVDLVGQYKNIKGQIDKAIQDVIQSSAFINGPQVKNLKNSLSTYLNCKHTITCGNGTDALQIALMALNLSEGDEVILPDFTFIATAEVVALLKLKPVFVDVDPDTFLMDLEMVKEKISDKTKVIIPVHLYGQCCNMTDLMQLAKTHGIYVVEDGAQAIGADVELNGKQVKACTAGHIGCTSFFPSKNLGCYGDGGAIFTNDDDLAEKIGCIANHGAKVKYYHDMVGVNSRLDTMQAAILEIKLKKLDEYSKARYVAAEIYDSLLADIPQVQVPVRVKHSSHVFHQYTLKVEKRDELKAFLSSKDIPSMVYYPLGMHQQAPYKTSDQFKVSDNLCQCVLSLPIHTELTKEQQIYIAAAIKEFYA